MVKKLLFFVFFLIASEGFSQESTSFVRKKYAVISDTITLNTVSINSAFFKITDAQGQEIDSSYYWVDFAKSKLVFKNKTLRDSVTVRYLNYPDFLTKTYSQYDRSLVVNGNNVLQSIRKNTRDSGIADSPFDGLTTSGSLTRGITVGNNQNAVVNSVLDLQISGKLSENITLRASIQDNNIPIQSAGYSQKLDQFDQVFIELLGNQWNVRAGDLFLENRTSSLLNFNKKVQGLATQFQFGKSNNKTTLYNSVGIVRGQYAKSNFTGQEGNQGPYKLKGSSGELYVLVISGSERVFVNGVLVQRGENKQYIIDYNAGEIIFNATFPINSEMRIAVEYQYSDRNYNRFITYNGLTHNRDKWHVGGYLYLESDIKNQALQQALSDDQKKILAEAGDNPQLMVAPSAVPETFVADKVLYKKVSLNGAEYFEYTTSPTDVVFNVRFSLQGNNRGNYILKNATAVNKIFEYVAPVNGIMQGNYEPIIKLVPPNDIQIIAFKGGYKNTDKTTVEAEIGMSKKDNNLFSPIDDGDNKGVAVKLNTAQRLFTKKWKSDVFANYQLIQQNFKPIERLFSIEFNRDWNLTSTTGDQSILTSGIVFELPTKGSVKYQHDYLQFGSSFSGNKHGILTNFNLQKWQLNNQASVLASQGDYAKAKFIRNQNQARFHFFKNWVGGTVRLEDNQERINQTQLLSGLSQRFSEYGTFLGRGDSTKVYAQIGYLRRTNDSLVSGTLQRVNHSQSYYLRSKLIQNDKNDLAVFVNYRELVFEDKSKSSLPSLNSRVLYNGYFLNQMVQTNTLYETLSGTVAQQEFTYLEVPAGRGTYTWIDYNNNGIQELSEFEVAKFTDQATFLRVFLPNQLFIKTHQNKFSNTLTLNPLVWQNSSGFKKVLSYFYNQTAYLIERKLLQKNNGFDLNPFTGGSADVLGLNTAIRNSLFYNRGKQNNSVTYNYNQNSLKNLLSIGLQKNDNTSHQVLYNHLIKDTWLFALSLKTALTTNTSENFESRNYRFYSNQINPKIGYVFTKETSLDVFYEFQQKTNEIANHEKLSQQRIGTSFTYVGKKQVSLNGEFSFYQNDYVGDANSPIAYQMLEGLLPGKNITWRLLLQRNITNYLDVNINYQGRKSENNNAIHTGSIQLRAHF